MKANLFDTFLSRARGSGIMNCYVEDARRPYLRIKLAISDLLVWFDCGAYGKVILPMPSNWSYRPRIGLRHVHRCQHHPGSPTELYCCSMRAYSRLVSVSRCISVMIWWGACRLWKKFAATFEPIAIRLNPWLSVILAVTPSWVDFYEKPALRALSCGPLPHLCCSSSEWPVHLLRTFQMSIWLCGRTYFLV